MINLEPMAMVLALPMNITITVMFLAVTLAPWIVRVGSTLPRIMRFTAVFLVGVVLGMLML